MTTETEHNLALDAQAAAGALGQVFARDVTTAMAVCEGCGRQGPFAELRLHAGGIGAVIRCPGCDLVLLRLVDTPRGLWLEMRGIRSLVFPSQH